jgi:DNA-binding NarL/FixJ family response regulator
MGVNNVVVLETNARVARSLAGKLSSHFNAVHLTSSGDELRERINRNHPQAVVLDMEASRLTDVRSLHRDYPSLPIVCTHRIPDERLWIDALEAGASDVCQSDDAQDVLTSVLRSVAGARAASA